MTRRDDSGRVWDEVQLREAIVAIVARLSPGFPAGGIRPATRLDHLGWDRWYRLRVVKPIHSVLHERLDDQVVLGLETVGELIAYVWSRMEDAP